MSLLIAGSEKVENIKRKSVIKTNKRKLESDNPDNSAANEASNYNLASNESSQNANYNSAANEDSNCISASNEASNCISASNEASSYNTVDNEASNFNSDARTRHDSDEPIDYQMKKKIAALAHAAELGIFLSI